MPHELRTILSIKLLYPDAQLPQKKYTDDAGLDLYCYEDLVLKPHETAKLNCGVAIDIPKGYFGLVTPRSSWRSRGLLCQSVFDAGFQGLIEPFVTNISPNELHINKGKRVLQMIILPTPNYVCWLVDDFPPSERGTRGAGSTGE